MYAGLPDTIELLNPIGVPALGFAPGKLEVHSGRSRLVVECVKLHDHTAVPGARVESHHAEPGIVVEQPILKTAAERLGRHEVELTNCGIETGTKLLDWVVQRVVELAGSELHSRLFRRVEHYYAHDPVGTAERAAP